ncbi:glycoside hydrolase family 3 C-terminal domain-containing protein [Streptomyces sp. NPDC001351]|uniref:glycoside hydrolase family 3 C-terminal domain-containing protein n=1 Tax=Streptomyces sp. NPDC001351 TaxID=3364564 RepID=UPI0036A1C585
MRRDRNPHLRPRGRPSRGAPGEAGGRAVAEALFGDVEPTGRLPVAFPRDVGRLPLSYRPMPRPG